MEEKQEVPRSIKLWKSEYDKLMKSGRKWVESDYIPYRYAELFCEKCGESLGKFDIVCTNLQSNMYCTECSKVFCKPTPFNITENIEVVNDYGTTVLLKYKDGYYDELIVRKTCYFTKKGRYINVKNKRYYI